MNKNPLVYIILPVYNWSKYFLEQLMSIYYQNYENWYLIVINDWSTDTSEKVARDWISHYNLYNKAKVINKENWWVTSAVQRWLGEIKGMCDIYNSDSLISYCDADDARTRNKLSTQVEYMINNPKCELSFHDLFITNEDWVVLNNSLLKWYYHNKSFLYNSTVWWFLVSTWMMFRIRYVDNILPMPTWKGMYQDYWTLLVFSLLGLDIWFIKKSLAFLRRWHSSLTSNKKSFFENRQYNYKFLQNRFPEKDLSYIIKCNQDWMVNRRNKYHSLIIVWLLLLIKYPRVAILYIYMKWYKLFHFMK